ncbi:adenosylmethionine--8-amino-7-oxononanoate transaminase [Xylophilus rhododendri]|uniref:Adenosylmethionine-8-amino-7-oxononanoate aminotransferase n=1 Tax=Xylophilus rhododendri TaxID=2697032 RepID=A0A857J0B2_9BURK|nr:adenosylmethionine--8-amino-7-oxononanoate transaminase [Xylophilus rhododendri]QHI96532.1 adenosylmethionine--8-amino-7-oxononanoate transaminase [Xylophilus rhododendri]
MSVPASNAGWQKRSLAAVWHPCTQMQRAFTVPPLPIARGEGPWLIDQEGQRYFDATSSWWVNLFGHADAGINDAIKRQLDTLPHVMLAGCTHAPAVELAERLSALTGGVLGHAFYASDGASAVEIALKMSFHFWRNQGRADKREFVCLKHSYHGETLGALSVTDVAIFRDTYDPLLMRAHLAASPDARQAGPNETAADVATRAAADMRRLLSERHEHIAAVIVEPLIQCAAGMAMHDPSYLQALRQLCDEFGVHLIADEIAVGCGRTGTFFACEQAGIWPDFVCLSKGITAGYLPLSLVLTRDAVFEAFLDEDIARGFLHSHSYTGNALACTAALAVLDRFEQEGVLAANRERSQLLAEALAPLRGDPRIAHFRQQGTIFAFDVLEAYAPGRFAENFHLAGRERGLLIRPIGRTVYLMPPYVLDAPLAAWLGARVIETLDAVCARSTTESHADRAPDPTVA